ncbi:hypothetical protein A2U01_0059506, partial [Trifolium medium]|nr:hypothetical protein [Trifolium medium]
MIRNWFLLLPVAPVLGYQAQLGARTLVAAHNASVPAPQAQIW